MARLSERPRRYVKSRLTGNAAAAGVIIVAAIVLMKLGQLGAQLQPTR